MKTEKQKMQDCELFDPADEELTIDRTNTRLLIGKLNSCRDDAVKKRSRLIQHLIPNGGTGLIIQPPFFCDYGYNIHTGENVFFNFNCVVLDVVPVFIGHRTIFGPNSQIYAAVHSLDYRERARRGLFKNRTVVIGDDVWIGGNVTICPGITIGHRCVIGAGSVVVKDIPDDSLAAGNPCRVIRYLDKNEGIIKNSN